MAKPLIQRKRKFDGPGVIPANSALRSAWKIRRVPNHESCEKCFRQNNPPLIEQRRTARNNARRPNRFDRISASLIVDSGCRDCEEVVIDDGQVVSGCKPICRCKNIGFAPTDELFAEFYR